MPLPVCAIVTDIEGTTTSVTFVYDILFPYAKAQLPQFLESHFYDPEVSGLLQEAAAEGSIQSPTVDRLIPLLLEWMEGDKKIGTLKTLQGMIWKKGFLNGDFQGHVYNDAYQNLKKWHANDLPLYIYSSGSVQAQKLLFGHSTFGDLTPLFSGFFDTQIGGKKEPASYSKIIKHIGQPAQTILFLSDVEEELDAARKAGMQTVLVCRESPNKSSLHPTITTFDELCL